MINRVTDRSLVTQSMLDAAIEVLDRLEPGITIREVIARTANAMLAVAATASLADPPSPPIAPALVEIAVAWWRAYRSAAVSVRELASAPPPALLAALLPVAASPSNPARLSARRVNAYLDLARGVPLGLTAPGLPTKLRFADITITGPRRWQLVPVAAPDALAPDALVKHLLDLAAARGPADLAEERMYLDAVRAGDVRPETEPYLSLYRIDAPEPEIP